MFVLSRGREGSGLDFSRDTLVLGWYQGPYLEGWISPFPFFLGVGGQGDFWRGVDRGGEFSMIPPSRGRS